MVVIVHNRISGPILVRLCKVGNVAYDFHRWWDGNGERPFSLVIAGFDLWIRMIFYGPVSQKLVVVVTCTNHEENLRHIRRDWVVVVFWMKRAEVPVSFVRQQ